VPPVPKPEPPRLLPIADACEISWQGSTGASEYDVLRSADPADNWKIVGAGISDAAFPYTPLFNDETAQPGKTYRYAIVARNAAGTSARSSLSEPVKVIERALVDNCLDLSQLAETAGDVQFATGEDRKTREDSHRLKLAIGGSVTYHVDEPISSWAIDCFFLDDDSLLGVSASADGEHFEACEFIVEERSSAKNDYNYHRYVVIRGDSFPTKVRYLRFSLPSNNDTKDAAQIGRVVIRYGRIAE
jgi:mannan endo-1,4-beta-mannosidase